MADVEFAGDGVFGDTTCGKVGCNAPALWDVMVALDPDAAPEKVQACGEHLDDFDPVQRVDMHPFGPVCNMPGSVWQASPDELSRCVWPVDDDVHALDVALT